MMKTKNSGFTLIELLVVIAIISILAAIIFPIFAAAKDKGRQTVCLSNLKQLGSAFRMYADEYDGCFPVSRVVEGGNGNPAGNWCGSYNVSSKCDPSLGQLFPYVKSVQMYLCPSSRGARPPKVTDPDAFPFNLSYSMNDGLSFVNCDFMKAPPERVGLLIHEDVNTIDDGDFNWSAWAEGPGGHNAPSSIHTGGTCVIYCDLHGKWKSKDALLNELKDGLWNPYQP